MRKLLDLLVESLCSLSLIGEGQLATVCTWKRDRVWKNINSGENICRELSERIFV